MVEQFALTTPDGVRIVGRHAGATGGGDIVFIHGFSMSSLCWSGQMQTPQLSAHRRVCYDLRGHGGSDKPLDPQFYREGQRWAHELRSVIDHLRLHRPILVAWSYAVRIVVDYLEEFGDDALGGINIVGSKINSNPAFAMPRMGALQQAMGSNDLSENITATIDFLKSCALHWPTPELLEALAAAMVVPAAVRRAMMDRALEADALFARLQRPVLFTHGTQDPIAPFSAAEHGAATAPHGALSLYDNAAHMPFLEDANRFNRELDEFVTRCRAASAESPAG